MLLPFAVAGATRVLIAAGSIDEVEGKRRINLVQTRVKELVASVRAFHHRAGHAQAYDVYDALWGKPASLAVRASLFCVGRRAALGPTPRMGGVAARGSCIDRIWRIELDRNGTHVQVAWDSEGVPSRNNSSSSWFPVAPGSRLTDSVPNASVPTLTTNTTRLRWDLYVAKDFFLLVNESGKALEGFESTNWCYARTVEGPNVENAHMCWRLIGPFTFTDLKGRTGGSPFNDLVDVPLAEGIAGGTVWVREWEGKPIISGLQLTYRLRGGGTAVGPKHGHGEGSRESFTVGPDEMLWEVEGHEDGLIHRLGFRIKSNETNEMRLEPFGEAHGKPFREDVHGHGVLAVYGYAGAFVDGIGFTKRDP